MANLTKIPRSNLPRNIAFREAGDTLEIIMSEICATANMQENNAAFEAWALVVKSVGYNKVALFESEQENELTGIKKLHYNRFLYRVLRFNEGFEWFSISDALKEKTTRFANTELKRDLFVNAPLTKPKVPNEKSHEAVMERLLADKANLKLLNDILKTKINVFYRQLPVGLFGERVITGNAIFPSDKAAIDLWGLDGTTFHLIELKVGSNNNLGVLSEVFFYACFIHDMYCQRHLERKDPADLQKYKKQGAFPRGYPELISANIGSVVVHILTERKHTKLGAAFAELQKHKLAGICFENAVCHPLSDVVVKPE